MALLKNIAGQQFAAWLVLYRVDVPRQHSAHWLCRCKCGVERVIAGTRLRIGMASSCGCESSKQNGDAHRTHGKSKSRTYHTWNGMRYRCNNRRSKDYPRYGGRGIKVCERWQSFEYFHADMGDAPDGMTIERKDNDGGYCPDNCRWATPLEQRYNLRSNRRISHQGVSLTVSE